MSAECHPPFCGILNLSHIYLLCVFFTPTLVNSTPLTLLVCPVIPQHRGHHETVRYSSCQTQTLQRREIPLTHSMMVMCTRLVQLVARNSRAPYTYIYIYSSVHAVRWNSTHKHIVSWSRVGWVDICLSRLCAW